MAFNPMGYVREHPYQAGAIGIVAVLAVYLVATSGGTSSSGTANTGIDPIAAQLSSQQAQLTAQSAAQVNGINGSIQALAQQGANDLAIATIQAHSAGEIATLTTQYQTTHDILAQELGIYSIQGEVTQAQLQADVSRLSITTAGMVQLHQLDSNEAIESIRANVSIANTAANDMALVQQAQIIGQTQQQISTNQSNVSIAQVKGNVEIAKAITAQKTTSGILGVIGQVAGIAAMALL